MHMRAPRGFSLVELLVSVAILGLLASVAMPLAELSARRKNESALRLALRDIRQGIDAYHAAAKNGDIASPLNRNGYPLTLEELTDGVADVKHPDGALLYFMRRIPRDPMFLDTSVKPADTWGKRSYASPADKPAEGEDVFDVYSTVPGAGLNGVPYKEW
jgi:general secretion pathway protein G